MAFDDSQPISVHVPTLKGIAEQSLPRIAGDLRQQSQAVRALTLGGNVFRSAASRSRHHSVSAFGGVARPSGLVVNPDQLGPTEYRPLRVRNTLF